MERNIDGVVVNETQVTSCYSVSVLLATSCNCIVIM